MLTHALSRGGFRGAQESKTSFSISPDGKLYSALTSSSTCALVDVGVSQGKAAWEFLLEEDSPRWDTKRV